MAPNEATTGTKGRAPQSSTTRKARTSAAATPHNEKRPVTEWLNIASEFDPEKYLAVIAELCQQKAEDILGERRFSRLIKPRHLFYATLRHIGNWSYPEIGDYVGRDHTTVMSAVARVPYQVVTDLRLLVQEKYPSDQAR